MVGTIMLRDPPHYLKPLKTTTTPKRLLWLSCHGNVVKKGSRAEKRFHVAALGKTWQSGKQKARKDTIDTYDSAAGLWAAVSAWCPVSKRVVLFGWGLAEQIRVAGLLTHLPALGWDLDRIVLERTAAWCLLRNGKRSLLCCGLQSWTPVPWEKLRADVVLGGPLPDDILAGERFAALRCERASMIIREAVMQIFDWIEGEDLGPFRPTGSGQSYAAYRRRFSRGRLL